MAAKKFELKVVIAISIVFAFLTLMFINHFIFTTPPTPQQIFRLEVIQTVFPYLVLIPLGCFIISAYTAWTELKETQIIQHSMPITEQFERKSLSSQKWRNKK
jgi:heme/copper-type cytochrome/quinol oxidase subunit 2